MTQPSKTKTCPKCEHASRISARFCFHCGWIYEPLLISEGGDYTDQEITECRNEERAEKQEVGPKAPLSILDQEKLTEDELVKRITRDAIEREKLESRHAEFLKQNPEFARTPKRQFTGYITQEEADRKRAEFEEFIKSKPEEKKEDVAD